MLTKFRANQTEDIKKYYTENGYVIIEKLIPDTKVNQVMNCYEKFKKQKRYLFRSQDTNRPELLQINSEGLIEHSILDPKDLAFSSGFSSAVEEYITDEGVGDMLTVLSEKQKHIIWQSMFFDKSTGTVAHQDHYYLDTLPDGNLIAAWYALEDIHSDAGPFYVYPKSHLDATLSRELTHEEFVKETQRLISKNQYQLLECPLNKGDVLFWHPCTIHGALNNKDKKYSRKSLTAHFIPEGFQRHDKEVLPETMPSRYNNDILAWAKGKHNDKIEYAKRYVRFFMNKFRNKDVIMEMKSEKYGIGE